MPKVKIKIISEERCRSYKELNYNELKSLVKSLETDSKRAKKDPSLCKQILESVHEAKTEIAKRIIK